MTDALLEVVSHQESAIVVVHPTVLLSIVDHYNRIASGTSKRVVGVLLGEYTDGRGLDKSIKVKSPLKSYLFIRLSK